MTDKFDATMLDEIIKKTVSVVEDSKEQIFDIAEQARKEFQRVQQELRELQSQLTNTIETVDILEQKEKRARLKLVEVSRNHSKFSEGDIQAAYEMANNLQMDILVHKEREKQLRVKRDKAEISLKKMEGLVYKAETLVSQVGLVLKLLSGNLQDLNGQIEEFTQRQQLGFRIIMAQEEERKRLSREIHDGPAQDLANIIMRAELCERMLTIDPHKVQLELKDLKAITKDSLQDLRKVIFDLRPMALDDLGIIPTLKRYLTNFEAETEILTELVCHGREQRFNSSLEATIFRTVQEGLTNIKNHAKATNVRVRFEYANDKLSISVKDNGRGFDPSLVLQNSERTCYGLVSMRERIELLEGELVINSEPDKGTELLAIIPVK